MKLQMAAMALLLLASIGCMPATLQPIVKLVDILPEHASKLATDVESDAEDRKWDSDGPCHPFVRIAPGPIDGTIAA